MKKLFSLLASLALIGTINAQNCNTRPIINGFTPNTGFIGSTVTINGANFDANNPQNNIVYFGATKAQVVTATFGQLEVIVPVGATTGAISVTNQCELTAYSKSQFNGIFCPTPLDNQTYAQTNFYLNGIYGAYNMMSQDMDLDGKPEVIMGSNGGGITIARNNSTPGAPSFSALNYGSGYVGNLFPADFDGDGFKDLVTTYAIYENTSTGPGSFGLRYVNDARSVSSYQVAAADFNNDGKIDIVGENGGYVWVALNQSTGPGNFNFSGRINAGYVLHRCTGLQAADIDGDGKADIVATQGNGDRAVSIRNTTANGSSSLSFENPEYWATGGDYPYRMLIADFNRDGKMDMCTPNFRNGYDNFLQQNSNANTAILVNTSTPGDISFNQRINRIAPNSNYRIGVGDVDGDGYADIVTKSSGSNVFSVYKNTTVGNATNFNNRIDYFSSARAEVSGIVIGDLDGDFVPDIATSGTSSRQLRIHRNTSSQNDVTAPTAICKNITVALDPTGNVTITPADIDNGSSDACGIDNLAISQSSFTCADIGPNQVTLTVTDNAGNQSTCTATVTVAPAAIIVTGQTTVCAGGTVTMNANQGDSYQWYKDGVAISGATNQTYGATSTGAYTVAVTNAGGCSGTSDPTNVVVNNNPTVNVSPANNAYLCNGTATLTASQSATYQWKLNGVDLTSADANLQSITVSQTGVYTVEVIDQFGCSATSSPVAVNPQAAPVASAQNFTVNLDGTTGTASITASDIENGSTGCGLSYSVSPSSFDCNSIGTNTVTLTVTDNQGQTSTATAVVTVLDPTSYCNVAPVAVAQNITVGVGANCTATISAAQVDGGSSDADQDPLTLSIDNAGPFGVGTYSVTLTADDGQASSTDVATVTVVDNSNPSALVQNVTVALDANGQATILTSGGSTVVFDGSFSNDGGGTKFSGTGLTNWNITAGSVDVAPFISGSTQSIDLAGNSNGKIESNSNISLAPGSYELSFIYKNNDGSPGTANSFSVNLGSAFSKSYTSALGSGNVSVTESITVSANETATLSFEQTGSNDASGTFLADIVLKRITPAGLMINNGSFDNCGLASVTASQVNFTCADLGANNVTLTATDIHGNSSTATAVVTVVDNINPVASAQGMTVQLDANGSASITAAQINNGSSDNCSIANMSLSQSSFGCGDVGPNNVTLTVTDQSGNSNSATVVVDVQDNVNPVVSTQNISVNLDAAGNASISAADVNLNSSDACGIASMSLDVSSFDCSNVGANTVTLTVTDVNGNSSTGSATVTVNDVTAPNVVTQNVTVYLDASGSASIAVADIENGSSDACGIASSSLDITSFSCADLGANTVVLSVTDVNGNTGTANATVTVVDDIDPVISNMPPSMVVVPQPNDCTPSVNWTAPSASDNCSVTLTSTHNPGDNFAVGTTTVTYTATDQSGNSVSASFDVTVDPTPVVVTSITSPTFIGGDNISCNGASDGSINITVDGGCEPYTYAWSNGSSAQNPSGLSAGAYDVTVTDANGQTTTATITLTEPAPVLASASSAGYLSGNGVTGTTLYLGYGPQSINLSASAVGGHGGYTYSWNNGAGTGANVTVSPTATTTYTVTVTDVNGCTDTEDVTVTVLDVRCAPGNSPSSKGKGNKGNGNGRQVTKVNVCHNGNTICIDSSAVAAHLANHNHGNKSCYLGACGTSAKNATAITSALDLHIYPNPTEGILNVQIHSDIDADIQIVLTDIQGRIIDVRSDYVVNGVTEAQFDLSAYASGVYIVKVIGLNEQQVSRLIKD